MEENKVSKNLHCICLRNGVEIWIENDRLGKLKEAITASAGHKFVEIDDEFINTADLVGVFSATTMDEVARRKNGQWRCQHGVWHDKAKKCECHINNMSGDELAKHSRGW